MALIPTHEGKKYALERALEYVAAVAKLGVFALDADQVVNVARVFEAYLTEVKVPTDT